MSNPPTYFFFIFFIILPLLYFLIVEIIWKCLHKDSPPPQTNHVSEIPQDDDVTTERGRAMEVVIDILDEPKIKGTNSDCCICLGEFEQEEEATCELILSGCCHRFHAACIIPWLLAKNETCPFCRACISTMVAYGQVEDLVKSFNDHQVL